MIRNRIYLSYYMIVLNKLNNSNSMIHIIPYYCTILLIRLVLQLLKEGKNLMMLGHDDYYLVLEILIYTLILIRPTDKF